MGTNAHPNPPRNTEPYRETGVNKIHYIKNDGNLKKALCNFDNFIVRLTDIKKDVTCENCLRRMNMKTKIENSKVQCPHCGEIIEKM